MIKVRDWVDRIATAVSATMTAVMMMILLCNVILRYIPGIGGFKWYMESSQYLNVWAMLIIGIQIAVRGTHLRVQVLDAIVAKYPIGQKIVKVCNSICIALFYLCVAYSGYLLSSKAKQTVSTMPDFTMGQVYAMIPIVCILAAAATLIDMIIFVSGKEEVEGGTKA